MSDTSKKIIKSYKQNNYPIGDFMIKVKNAVAINQKEIVYQQNSLVYEVAKKLKDLGFFEKVEKNDDEIKVNISYHKKEPVIISIDIVSRPGLRVYKSAQDLAKEKGPSVFIVTTSKGILSHKEAIKQNVGGEVLAEIL
ncbi:30S ribosomal protein S8 [Candidatus Woesebacteria bacterium]|nr:30S ribosomal protein S8 [Candidatus Woesebacteria bacterium]